jgi:hypothetical protein
MAHALASLGVVLAQLGEPAEGVAAHERGLAVCRLPEDAWILAFLCNHAAEPLCLIGEHAAARARLAEALAYGALAHDPWLRGITYFFQGELEDSEGNLGAAAAAFAQGSLLMREVGDAFGVAWTTMRHAYVRLREGDLTEARTLLAESLAHARDLGHTTFILLGLAGCAALAAHDGRDATAVQLFARADQLLSAPAGDGGLTSIAARASCGPALEVVHARREPALFAAEWASGLSLTLEDALSLALAGSG